MKVSSNGSKHFTSSRAADNLKNLLFDKFTQPMLGAFLIMLFESATGMNPVFARCYPLQIVEAIVCFYAILVIAEATLSRWWIADKAHKNEAMHKESDFVAIFRKCNSAISFREFTLENVASAYVSDIATVANFVETFKLRYRVPDFICHTVRIPNQL